MTFCFNALQRNDQREMCLKKFVPQVLSVLRKQFMYYWKLFKQSDESE